MNGKLCMGVENDMITGFTTTNKNRYVYITYV